MRSPAQKAKGYAIDQQVNLASLRINREFQPEVCVTPRVEFHK
jgi:hypothetical protein